MGCLLMLKIHLAKIDVRSNSSVMKTLQRSRVIP